MFFGGLTIAINGFSMVFFIFLPSLSMVFDGSGPLVGRCDGFDGSLWSIESIPKVFAKKEHNHEICLFRVNCGY